MILFACLPGKKTITPTKETRGKPGGRTDSLLASILHAHPQYFDSILRRPGQNDIQVIYTQIDRNEDNEPRFTYYYYGVDPQRYFYPASTVKFPAAILSLQKLRELDMPGLNRQSTMITEAGYSGQTAVYNEPTSIDGRPTIEHYIKKVLLVSDNEAFNRLYEFLGQEYLNATLRKMDFDSTEIIHRLEIFLNEDQNRHTNPVQFFDTSGSLLYAQPLVKSGLAHHTRHTFLGKGFFRGGSLVEQPFDFSKKNRLTLPDLHSMVQGIMFPEGVPAKERFWLEEEDLQLLRKYMSMYPRESSYPSYDSSYNDAYVKFLMYGSKDPVNPEVRIFNKVGDAYGFLTDAAYIVDFENGVEFMLSATIHCNSDSVYNDNRYDYETVGLPFMKHLGEVIYQHELKRKKEHRPDLSAFRFDYGDTLVR